jgi:CheY-like chemotaxis protein
MTGFDFLTWVRQEPELRHLPVVILTTSTYSPDVKRAYQLGANSFLTKPTHFATLVSEVKQVSDFWLHAPGTAASAN